MITNYNLCDTVYARAKLDVAGGKVFLWVGANTMVEYTVEEAEEMLISQVSGAMYCLSCVMCLMECSSPVPHTGQRESCI
jgi:hypothetical protein